MFSGSEPPENSSNRAPKTAIAPTPKATATKDGRDFGFCDFPSSASSRFDSSDVSFIAICLAHLLHADFIFTEP